MSTKKRVLVPLAPGFEEIEAITIVDVLRRAEVEVTLAGLGAGPVEGAHGIGVATDCELGQVDAATLAMVVLPGGMPGAKNLMEDERVLALLRTLHADERPVAAICAAPMVLAAAGVLGDGDATCYPGFEDRLGNARVRDARVVKTGSVITSRGPGTALEFALALVGELCGEARARELARAMIAWTGALREGGGSSTGSSGAVA